LFDDAASENSESLKARKCVSDLDAVRRLNRAFPIEAQLRKN
jgi:hypothetical protein